MNDIELAAVTKIPNGFFLVCNDAASGNGQPCEFSYQLMVGDRLEWGIHIGDMVKFLKDNGDCTISLNYAGIPVITIRGDE